MVVGDEVEQVYVGATARGTGLAATLLSEAEAQVAAAGHDTAWLAVATGNARARRFYERCGWVDEGDLADEVDRARRDLRVAVPALHETGAVGRYAVGQTCTRVSTASTTRAMASSIGTPLSWWPSR